jgi:hypothetical protein
MAYDLPDGLLEGLVCAAIDKGQLPPTLYRYRDFNGHTEKSICDGVQKFSRADTFNDPFDCQIRESGDFTSEQLLEALVQMGMRRVDASTVILKNAQEGRELMWRLLDSARHETMNRAGILCLSEKFDDILMWSHYANCHSGYVLGFEVKADPTFFAPLFRIKYDENYPVFSHITEPQKIVEKGMITKSLRWNYEAEVRIIKHQIGLIPYKKSALKEVILGCKVSDENQALMATWLATNEYRHVTMKKARVSGSSYELIIDTVSVGNVV